MRKSLMVSVVLLLGLTLLAAPRPAPTSVPAGSRAALVKKFHDGNYKDAYEGLSLLAMDPKDDPDQVSQDLTHAVSALNNLGRSDEVDDFREKVIAAHADNWKLLWTAARTCMEDQHYGTIVAGTFERGDRRSQDGKRVSSFERDRTRALQLMQQAMEKLRASGKFTKNEAADFYFSFADMLLNRHHGGEAWRLQYLTDLSVLPDYEESHYYGYSYGYGRGAPVDAKGNPVFHKLPKSWKDASSDGERWRWCLAEAGELSPDIAARAQLVFADFLREQFDVQTMGWYGRRLGMDRQEAQDDGKKDESGPYAVSTLGEDETNAKLANGIKRFKLPDEFNFIKVYLKVADDNRKNVHGDTALGWLAEIFMNRQQYPRAAEMVRRNIEEHGKTADKQHLLDQIVGNWGMFESIMTQPAGQEATVEFRFRNGKKVRFEAHEVNTDKLLSDVKAYLKADPGQLDWEKLNIADVGWRLVAKDQKQYLGKQAAAWELDLKPRDKHFDKRITVKTPLKTAGAYLLKATMDRGNTAQIVLWLADTTIVRKPLDQGGYYYFVADAVTGSPIPKAKLDFFGYQQKHIRDRKYEIKTDEFGQAADETGQLLLNKRQEDYAWRWIITARADGGRMAYMGFAPIWHGSQRYDAQYNQTKALVITDRPVYRPYNPVHFKVWVNTAKYDQDGPSEYAGKTFTVRIQNPKGDKVVEQEFKADEFGGLDGQFQLDREATLGVWGIQVLDQARSRGFGGGSFRVEEYKKPEFEVKIDAPAEPVMLGEKIQATINAKYYFGAPVTSAKVKFKVMRTEHTERWFPRDRWDWMYEPGYWWFGYDYPWYPGWGEWGCKMPYRWWWGRPRPQPEIVSESELPIGADGTIKVDIDTAVAKATRGDEDHKYEISAEVTDESRRTITGSGSVLVARKPFKVYSWVDRGHYRTGDAVLASFSAQTLDKKPVKGKGDLRLLKIAYDKDLKPTETEVQKWDLDTNEEGRARQQLKAAQPGQYRLSYALTDAKGHKIEGGYLFVVHGEGFDGKEFRFSDIELVPDKREYAPEDKIRLMINTNRKESTVVLFVRPANGIYVAPKLVKLAGKSVVEEIEVAKKDMPNFFVEAFTVSGGKVFSETREIVVPPEKRVLNVEVKPSADKYKPGEKAKMTFRLTDLEGKPFEGSAVVSIYDKSVEYISGGSNVPEIKEFFWKWRRHHYPRTESSLHKGSTNLARPHEITMQFLGVFGYQVADLPLGGEPEEANWPMTEARGELAGGFAQGGSGGLKLPGAANGAVAKGGAKNGDAMPADRSTEAKRKGEGGEAPATVEPMVRKNFADTALWVGSIRTDKDGRAEVELAMPENLTTWKTRVWAMGHGTKVGEGTAEVTTTKNLIIRLQAPRFFVQKDEVVLSANVHNYVKAAKTATVSLEVSGPKWTTPTDKPPSPSDRAEIPGIVQTVRIEPGGEKRVDWRIQVLEPGEMTIRMKAVTDEESDATEMKFPVYIHGMLKTESWSGAMRPADSSASLTVTVPKERKPEQSRLEIRYSPTIAMAMVDAIPYLADYPYGCTEQTLNRFVPTVIAQKVLLDMKLDLRDIRDKRANLNPQEIGDDADRAKQWKRWQRNPVFDPEEVAAMVKSGVDKLVGMQLSDGGWGWFSGWGEHSWPHTTAVVVHGLQTALANDANVPKAVIDRGVNWLKSYQAKQVQMLKNAPTKKFPWKDKADNLDALVFMVLVDSGTEDKDMLGFLYRDRTNLSVYAKAAFGLALHAKNHHEELAMIMENIRQFLVVDDENQTAYLKLPAHESWYWYGSETEGHGYYLKLLARTDAKGQSASRIAKYVLNNRKNSTYWNSTRDTAVCIEALAEFARASGETRPDLTLAVLIDGKEAQKVKIDASNLFTFDNKVVLAGKQLADGQHRIDFRKEGNSPLYFNAYLTNFTLEDPITKAGLEIKVNRKFYKLLPVDKTVSDEGATGQVLGRKVEKFQRQEIADGSMLKSGEMVEVELFIESKNDYEYIMFEDMKAAGFEPVEIRSGYNGNDLRAYMELRDERVCFFVRALGRGTHSVAYRVRAEIPGAFSALPTRASAMYAPELRANSDEFKVKIAD
jgi:uncharacterized protein YfaS (alpha-2-macroglobulin family)